MERGDRFGDLEIQRELGKGAFGVVYLAQDTLIGRPVALKVVRLPGQPNERERQRILDEARLIGQLPGEHVATLYRVHPLPDEGGWVFEMEYVEGGSLQEALGLDRRLDPERVTAIAQGILRGLREAHLRTIVHGDIKPGNVLLTGDGGVKLVDFGLSRIVGELSASRSDSAELRGTPVYMAPETVMGEPPGPAADLWSTGVVLYRMLSGRVPFPDKTLPALFHAIQNAEPPPLDPALPRALVALTRRCLAKSAADRPADCDEALDALSSSRVAARTSVPAAAPRENLFGRDAEIACLHEAARQVAARHGRTVILSGETGAGKTALALNTVAFTQPFGFRWIEARATELEGLLRPLLAGLRRVLLSGRATSAEQRLLESRLFGTATQLTRDLRDTGQPMVWESRQQILWELEQFLAGLAEEGPVGLLIEDAHLAHGEDQALLDELALRTEPLRVLLLITYRSHGEEGPPLAREKESALLKLSDREDVVHLPCGPLEADAVAQVLNSQAGDATVSAEVLRHVLRVAEGNPLFTTELFRHLRETNAVEREGDELRPGPAWERTTLPRRLRELVLLRLRGLPEGQRALLDIAAVDGVEFDGEMLARVLEQPLLEVLRGLQEIFRRTGLVVPRTEGYRFANAILQEGICEELAPDLRRALHARLAAHLEALPGTLPERLGVHWEGAGLPEKARAHFVQAAHAAQQRQEQLRAVAFLHRAGLDPEDLDADTAQQHADLLLDISGCFLDLGRSAQAETIFQRLLEASGEDEVLRMRTLARRAPMRYQLRGLAGLDEQELRRISEALPDGVDKGRTHYLLGTICKYRGDLEEAEAFFERADSIFEAHDAQGLHSSALDQRGSVALRHGRWREAEALYGDAARISAVAGRRTNAAISEINRAYAAFNRGALDGLAARYDESIRVLTLEGATNHVAHATLHKGFLRYALGDRQGAEADTDSALAVLRQSRYLMGLTPATVERAHLVGVAGNLELAEQTLAEASRLSDLTEDYSSRLKALGVTCQVACWRGDLPVARRVAADALAQARQVAELPPRVQLFFWVVEGVLYGLPAEIAADAAALVDEVAASSPAHAAVAQLVSAGMVALTDPAADGEPLARAAEALRGPEVGPRRAILRAVAGRLAAEGHVRAGETDKAIREAESTVEAAAAVGHAWMEAHVLRLLCDLDRGAQYRDRLDRHVRRLAALLGAKDDRRRLLELWLND